MIIPEKPEQYILLTGGAGYIGSHTVRLQEIAVMLICQGYRSHRVGV
jgi:UDP-glucose 4-epimerase